MKPPKAVAVIPARKGSKRFPGKNTAMLNSRPLISYTIQAAQDSGCFDEVLVSSDDEAVGSLAREAGVSFHHRDGSLATDNVTLADFLSGFLTEKSYAHYDFCAVLLATCPLRTGSHIREAFQMAEESNFVISVTEYEFPPQFALTVSKDNRVQLQQPEIFSNTRKQSHPVLHHPNGAVFLFPIREFLKQKTFYGTPLKAITMNREESVDIDYPYQLQQAELFLQLRNNL